MTRARILRVGAILAALLLVVAIVVISIARSNWFYERVRLRIISTVETASGGRVEIGAFTFDWKRLRAEVTGLVLHGSEAADKPPLLRASSVAVGLKIISILKRDVDIQYLDVQQPEIYLIVYPDGRTNVPEPKIKKSDKSTMETILDLAIGRFNIEGGMFEVEAHNKAPFSARGEHLLAHFAYDLTGPRYRGTLAVQPLEMRWPGLNPTALGVDLALVLERNRIALTSGKLATGNSHVELAGTLEDLDKPHATFHYDANVAAADAARILNLKELKGGSVQSTGDVQWPGGDQFLAGGHFLAEHVEYRDSSLQLHNFRGQGDLHADPRGFELTTTHVNGAVVAGGRSVPAAAQIGQIIIHPGDIHARGIELAALGGHFHGEARLRNSDRFQVSGDLKGFDARKTVAIYSSAPLPWDAAAAGKLDLEGSLRRKSDLRASVSLTLAPVAGSAPVNGGVTAAYDAGTGILELGNSSVSLPHTRADFSGAIGRQMRFHVETTDLGDILPALGDEAAAIPVKMENGRVVFDGTVTGTFDEPSIAGILNATNVSYSGNSVESLLAQVTVSPGNLRVQNAVATRGALRAQFQIAVGLDHWKTNDGSMIFGDGSIRNAPVADLAAIAGKQDLGATGTVTASAKLTGTIGSPLIDGDVDVTKGEFRGEPFDRLALHVNSARDLIQAANGQLDAGPKQVKFSASYQHAPGKFDTGRAKFEVASNTIALDQIQTLKTSRPGLQGTAQVTASGEVELKPAADGTEEVRPIALQADVNARGLQLTGQQLGNAHLTARSEGNQLRAHLDSDFAGSQVRGDGQWRMDGDYPGEATLTFTKLDFAQLRAWISPSANPGQNRFAGSAEGELRLSGPALKLEAIQAELRLPQLEIGPAPGSGVPGGLVVRNQGPILARMSNSVVTLDSARLTGRETDLSLSGKVSLKDKSPLDVRASGRIGLGLMADFVEDLIAEGSVVLDATVRGDFTSPQVTGRMQLDRAAFSLADVPNGISNASGVILFNSDRATIQSLTGETGGGTMNLTGFYAFNSGDTFRLHADVRQVRVRYPEGVSTVADASLTLVGTIDRSTLSGNVTILRSGFNPQSDFSSILASSTAPLQTPSIKPGLLSGMKFDVAIETDPQIQFQSSLTQDLQMDANLHLRGTPANPAVTGRINITQGEVVFYGSKFTINQGSVSFYNPSKFEPILDIDLETRAHGVDVTLTVSGPVNKLNLTPRSDPPMQFSEIVQLLATGHAPSSDPVIISQQTSPAQSWQQMGASTLLGQVVNSPVGRLQRLFGVSKLRIDPTIGGVENNPQARLTLEQQVTHDITFTYITNVTSGNPQVVRVEWAFSKQWSVVALREETGVTGLDFFFKKRF